MKFNVHGTLSGQVRWSVLDENGVVESGGHWNSNLITNNGLHQFGISPAGAGASGNTTYPTFGAWRRYCAVGTGTTPPSFTDAVLEGEIQRTTNTGGFSHSNSRGVDDGGSPGDPSDDVLFYNSTMVRHFTFNEPVSLGNYAYFTESSGGQPVISELFRDIEGNPIVLEIQGGRQLRIEHMLTIRLPFRAESSSFVLEEYDAQDVLTQSTNYNITKSFYAVNADGSNINSVFLNVFAPSAGTGLYYLTSNPPETAPTASPGNTTAIGNMSVRAYDYGDPYKRRKRILVDTSTGNRQFRGFAISNTTNPGGQGSYGHKSVFTNPTSFTKAETHLLEVEFEVSWNRG